MQSKVKIRIIVHKAREVNKQQVPALADELHDLLTMDISTAFLSVGNLIRPNLDANLKAATKHLFRINPVKDIIIASLNNKEAFSFSIKTQVLSG